MPLTLKMLLDAKKKLDKIPYIKPFKGYLGLGPNGLFEIKSQKQFEKLRKVPE